MLLTAAAVSIALIVTTSGAIAFQARHHLHLLVLLRRWPDENDLALRRRVVELRRRQRVLTPRPAPQVARPSASPGPAATSHRSVLGATPSTVRPVGSMAAVQPRRPTTVMALGLLGLVALIRHLGKSR